MTVKDFVLGGSVASSVAAFGIALYQLNTNRKLARKLDKSIDYILDHSEFEIADVLIEEETKIAVQNQVHTQAVLASKDVRSDMQRDIHNEVFKAVQEMKEDVRDDVREELERKAKQVSVSDIKREVMDDVKKQAKKKVDAKIDEVVEKHTDQLEEITKLYNTINKSVATLKEA